VCIMTKHNFLNTCKHALVASGLLLPVFTMAAVNGTVGPTSTGNVTVFINVNSEVKVSGLSDYNHVWDGKAYEFTKDFCVYSNTPDNHYTVTVTGTNNTSEFKLINQRDPGHPVHYQVQYQDVYGQQSSTYAAVNAGEPLVMQKGSGAPDCNGQNNTKLKFLVEQANGTAGNYTGQINVTVMPQ